MKQTLAIICVLLLDFTHPAIAEYSIPIKCKTRLDASIFKHNLILFGELHGTNEVPEFFLNAVCHSLKYTAKTYVFLEKFKDEQSYISDYLNTQNASISSLIHKQPSWRRKLQDGRRSDAIAALLVQLKALKQQGANIEVIAVAPTSAQYKKGMTKAQAMAQNVRETIALSKDKQALYLGLFGRTHVRVDKISRNEDTPKKPAMGYLLKDLNILSLEVKHLEGTSWVCYPGKNTPFECGSKERKANSEKWTLASNIMMYDTLINGYHGSFFVGVISSSPPAIDNFKKL